MSLSPALQRLLTRHAVGGSLWQALGGTAGDGLTTPVIDGTVAQITGWAILVTAATISAVPTPAFIATPGWHFVCDAAQPIASGQHLQSVADPAIVVQVMDVQRQPDGVFCTLKVSA